MWAYALFLFALCGVGLVESETSCDDNIHTVCPFLPNTPSFPKTGEELLELCPKLLAQLDCVQSYFDRCHDETFDEEKSLPKVRAYATEVCKEDSTIRADIVEELPCLKQVYDEYNETCHNHARAAMFQYLEENDPDYDHRRASARKYYCFYVTAQLSCMAADVDVKCGAKARDIVLDAHLRTGYLDPECQKDEIDELLQLVTVLEMELEHKERIGSILRTHKGSDDLISTIILR